MTTEPITDAELEQSCPQCGQIDHGQYGEYPCAVCGLPMLWDSDPDVALVAAPDTAAKETR